MSYETMSSKTEKKTRHVLISVLVMVSLIGLSILAFQSAARIQDRNQDGMSWQQEKMIPLLQAGGVWLAVLAAVAGVVPWIYRTDHLKPRTESPVPPWAWITLTILIVAYVGIYGWVCNRRHSLFNSGGYDLAIKEQVLWNTLNGRFFASSLEVDNAFADHFQPIMLFFMPAYAVFRSPRLLIWIQTLALAAGAIPLFILAQRRLGSPVVGLAMAATYLSYPPLGFINRFDFHPEALAVPAFLAAFEALDRDDLAAASFWLLIPLLSKENLGFSVAAFGLYALVFKRKRTFGLTWMGVGVAVSLATMFWLIPALREAPSDSLSRYEWLGETPQAMIATLVREPDRVWDKLTNPTRGLYLLQLMVPTGFLALIGIPELMMALPGLAINLLADHFLQNSIYCQYTVPIVPFVFVAAVAGLARIRRSFSPWYAYVLGLGCLFMVIVPFKIDFPLGQDPVITNLQAAYDALAVVPDRVSLVTTNAYAPHLAHRAGLFVLGFPAQRETPTDPEIVFVNLYDQRYILCDGYRTYFEALDLDQYGVIFRDRGMIVVQRNGGSNEAFRDFVLNWTDCAG